MSTNPTQFIEMDFDEWCDVYKPIKNHIDKDSSFNGEMFETYGDEVAFVKEQPEDRIWMYGDGDDGGTYIWNGWGFVNRIGYFITEVPCPPNVDIQVKVSSYWFYCEACSAEIEDEGQLINDKYYDLGYCPECATVEQKAEAERESD
jgi:hypothetical protein